MMGDVLERQLLELCGQSPRELIDGRYEKYRKMGQYFDVIG